MASRRVVEAPAASKSWARVSRVDRGHSRPTRHERRCPLPVVIGVGPVLSRDIDALTEPIDLAVAAARAAAAGAAWRPILRRSPARARRRLASCNDHVGPSAAGAHSAIGLPAGQPY